MFDWSFAEWLKFALVWLAIFAVIGGIISQTTGGMSGRGFMEGMWKGVEWYFIVVVVCVVLVGVLWGMGMISTTLNSSG